MLGYTDFPLGLDSAPLVSQMMEDLIASTESLQEKDQILADTQKKVDELEARLEPLESENGRLTRDNLQLHQQLISGTEDAIRLDNQHTATAFELQAENRRLKLLNQKAGQHTKELLKQIDQLKDELQQSLAAPSTMKTPEVIESDPRKIRKGSRTPSSSRATSVISSAETTSFSAPSISFDPNLFNIELDNLRKERDAAQQSAEGASATKAELENLIAIRDKEIQRLGARLQVEASKDGLLVLRHQIDVQNQEIEKLTAQVRVVNPTASPARRHRNLDRPRVIFSTSGETSPPSGDNEGGAKVTYEAVQPVSESRTTASVSSATPAYSEEDSEAKVREPIVPEPGLSAEMLGRSDRLVKKAKGDQRKLQKQLRIQQKQGVAKDQEISGLSATVQELTKTIADKERTIATLAVDFAFISDNLGAVMSEKDQLIEVFKTMAQEPDEIIVDTEEIDRLRIELQTLQTKYDSEIRRSQTEQTQVRSPQGPCQDCAVWKDKHADALAESKTIQANAQEEIQKLRNQNKQLGILVQSMQDAKSDSPELDHQLKLARNELTAKDAEIEQMRVLTSAQQTELAEFRKKYEEIERQLSSMPSAEDQYKATIGQLKVEHSQLVHDLKARAAHIKGLNGQLAETQQAVRELQLQLQKAREEATEYKEDAVYHRTKGEEIQRRTSEQTKTLIKDANAAVQTLQQQLDEKTRESEAYQRLLSDARRQLAPLAETTVPQLRSQIARLYGEREELVRRVKRVIQASAYIEQAARGSPDSPEAAAFSAAIRQLQEELKVFDK
jgi:chromosome segregation ATPase